MRMFDLFITETIVIIRRVRGTLEMHWIEKMNNTILSDESYFLAFGKPRFKVLLKQLTIYPTQWFPGIDLSRRALKENIGKGCAETLQGTIGNSHYNSFKCGFHIHSKNIISSIFYFKKLEILNKYNPKILK